MADDNMILRTVYLPPETDLRLRGIAFRLGRSKNALIRDFVAEALAQDVFPAFETAVAAGAASMVLRTVYLPAHVDVRLRTLAFEAGRSKNDLIRQCVALGLEDFPIVPFGEDTPVTLSPSRIRDELIEPVVAPRPKPLARPAKTADAAGVAAAPAAAAAAAATRLASAD